MKPFFDYVVHINPIHMYAAAVFFGYMYLASKNKLPQVESMRKLTAMLDDRGGNILVLGVLSCWYFIVTVKLFYHAITMISNGTIKADDAILLMALNTVSSGAYGTCFGALLKTLTGTGTVPPPSGATAAHTVTVTDKTETGTAATTT